MYEPLSRADAVFEQLEPKIIANNVSKLSGFEAVSYADVLALTGNPEAPLPDRLHTLASFAGDASLTDTLISEVQILRLCATGREDEVADPDRQRSYARSDANQIKDAASQRDLDYFLQGGIEVIFDPEARAQANRFCQVDKRDVPLIEKLKAKRLVTINGFDDSRVMYAVHDMIDHAWLFDQMREQGIMDRYSDFLGSIEMGENAFLYSRQAELLASVGFGARRWDVARSQGEELIFQPEDIVSILQSSPDDPRTAHAITLLNTMDPDKRMQAVFMVENMAVQLTDERRRWGAVKQVEGGERRPMDLLDPVHVALMVETLDMLQQAEGYGDVQLQATVEVEKMLVDAVNDPDGSDTLRIPIPRGNVTASGLEIVADHEAWLRNNLSVSTSYNKIG